MNEAAEALKHPVVKEGWLLKRGEHIRNWRPRYFKLFENGLLLGFKSQPKTHEEMRNPLNIFTIKDCQILKTEKPKPFTFLLRGLHADVIVRMFNAENGQTRDCWCEAIGNVTRKLHAQFHCEWKNQDRLTEAPQRVALSSRPIIEINAEPTKKKLTLDDFECVKVIGRGTFGKVVVCREKASRQCYAMKIIKKSTVIERGELTHTLTENRVMKNCRYPFITQLKYSFQTPDRLCFVMEFFNGGDLHYHLTNDGVFSEDRTRFYAAEILSALGYLHDNGIIHRDLKLENVLLDCEGHVRLADFGLCKESVTYGDRTRTFCGTPEYLAPEIIERNEYGRAVDWWALGVITHEMITGKLPFENEDQDALFEMIVLAHIRLPGRLTACLRDIIKSLLAKDPAKRLGGGPADHHDIKSHQFFSGVSWDDLLNKRYTPPFKPAVADEADTKCFDHAFHGGRHSSSRRSLTSIKEEECPEIAFSEFSYQSDNLLDTSLESGIDGAIHSH